MTSSVLPVPAGPMTSVLDPDDRPPPAKRVELGDAALEQVAAEALALLGRDQAREHLHAAGADDEVVVAAAKRLAAALGDAQPPPLGAVDRRKLLELDDAVGDAVHRAVVGFAGQVVEHDHGRVMLGEIMFEREDLPPVAQRALRQQPDFRQAVDHHALRPNPLDRFEHARDRFAELEVRRIEQALVLLRIEHAVRRHQLEDFDRRVDLPAVRAGAVAQFVLGLGQRDIDPALAGLGAGEQELQGDGGLAGARAALEQMHPVAGPAAA